MPNPRAIDHRDLQGYISWALEHVLSARLAARDLCESQGTQDALEEAHKQLQAAHREIEQQKSETQRQVDSALMAELADNASYFGAFIKGKKP